MIDYQYVNLKPVSVVVIFSKCSRLSCLLTFFCTVRIHSKIQVKRTNTYLWYRSILSIDLCLFVTLYKVWFSSKIIGGSHRSQLFAPHFALSKMFVWISRCLKLVCLFVCIKLLGSISKINSGPKDKSSSSSSSSWGF